jgi:hypothetical protein
MSDSLRLARCTKVRAPGAATTPLGVSEPGVEHAHIVGRRSRRTMVGPSSSCTSVRTGEARVGGDQRAAPDLGEPEVQRYVPAARPSRWRRGDGELRRALQLDPYGAPGPTPNR